ncbi:MAG TPA: MarR family transcriptional regulator [Promineifilum sp.]|nr:MarR family transcriptional regulator [Promineifilum sp.]
MKDFRLERSIGHIISQVSHSLGYELRQAFKKAGYDVTPQQWGVLTRLWVQDGLSQTEIANMTFKDRPVITRIIDVLERKEMVTRRPSEQDRRIVRVYLTQKGREYQEKLVPLAKEVLERGLADISDEDLAHMTTTLQKIVANLE